MTPNAKRQTPATGLDWIGQSQELRAKSQGRMNECFDSRAIRIEPSTRSQGKSRAQASRPGAKGGPSRGPSPPQPSPARSPKRRSPAQPSGFYYCPLSRWAAVHWSPGTHAPHPHPNPARSLITPHAFTQIPFPLRLSPPSVFSPSLPLPSPSHPLHPTTFHLQHPERRTDFFLPKIPALSSTRIQLPSRPH